jgi:hypothetical protein
MRTKFSMFNTVLTIQKLSNSSVKNIKILFRNKKVEIFITFYEFFTFKLLFFLIASVTEAQ